MNTINKKDEEKLFEAALKGYNNAYAIYSHFQVGASALLSNGEVYYGSNIENASYGLCNCAERTTLFNIYSKGYRKDDIVCFMVIGKTNKPVSPCGACRQVMSELLNPDTPVILGNLNKQFKYLTVIDLLPYSFIGDNLNE